jgi:gliding motility-associated-like protein
VSVDDIFKIYEGSFATGSTALNDFDRENEQLTFNVSAPAKNGTLVFNSDGSFTYNPNPGFLGTETVPYQVCNISGICSSANLIIRVVPFSTVNLTPIISNVREGKKVTVTARLEKVFPDDVVIKIGYSGSAIKDRDYVLLDQFIQIMIPKGQLTTTQKITVAALTDDLQEGDESIIIQILSTSDPEVKIGIAAVVTIGDVYPPDPVEIENSEAPKNPDISTDPLFSPNNDGAGNDVFNIVNIVSFPDNEVVIFNRWGNEVFRMKGYNESDRVFKGYANTGLLSNSNTPLVDGVYFYLITTRRTNNGIPVTALNKGYLILKR